MYLSHRSHWFDVLMSMFCFSNTFFSLNRYANTHTGSDSNMYRGIEIEIEKRTRNWIRSAKKYTSLSCELFTGTKEEMNRVIVK